MSEPSPRNLFVEGDVSAAILRKWWKGLQTDTNERDRIRGCGDPSSVMLSPEYQRLLDLLKDAGYDSRCRTLIRGRRSRGPCGTGYVGHRSGSELRPPDGSAERREAEKPESANSGLSRLVAQQQREMAYLLLIAGDGTAERHCQSHRHGPRPLQVGYCCAQALGRRLLRNRVKEDEIITLKIVLRIAGSEFASPTTNIRSEILKFEIV